MKLFINPDYQKKVLMLSESLINGKQHSFGIKRPVNPLCNAIVWQDTRTDTLCNKYALEGGSDRFREKTGLPLATYFSGPKITWLFENIPGVKEAAASGDLYFGNADSWIIWNLTGGVNGGLHITDVTNASRTMLMDLSTLEWDQEILAIFGIPESILPKIMPSSMVYGLSKDPFAGIPVASDFGDQQAALFGQTCFEAGEVKNTYGTGCFMLMNTGEKAVVSKNGLLTTVGYKIGDEPSCILFGRIDRSNRITGAMAAG